MSLPDFELGKITPTFDQQNAFKIPDAFFKLSHQCFLLKGYAVTEKDTYTRAITKRLSRIKHNPILTAPTTNADRPQRDRH